MKYSGHFMILNSGIFLIAANNMESMIHMLIPYILFWTACIFFFIGMFLLSCSFVKFIYLNTPEENE